MRRPRSPSWRSSSSRRSHPRSTRSSPPSAPSSPTRWRSRWHSTPATATRRPARWAARCSDGASGIAPRAHRGRARSRHRRRRACWREPADRAARARSRARAVRPARDLASPPSPRTAQGPGAPSLPQRARRRPAAGGVARRSADLAHVARPARAARARRGDRRGGPHHGARAEPRWCCATSSTLTFSRRPRRSSSSSWKTPSRTAGACDAHESPAMLASIVDVSHIGYPLLFLLVMAESGGRSGPRRDRADRRRRAGQPGPAENRARHRAGRRRARSSATTLGYLIGRKGGRWLLERPGRFHRQRLRGAGDRRAVLRTPRPQGGVLRALHTRPARVGVVAGRRHAHALALVRLLERLRRHLLGDRRRPARLSASATPPATPSKRSACTAWPPSCWPSAECCSRTAATDARAARIDADRRAAETQSDPAARAVPEPPQPLQACMARRALPCSSAVAGRDALPHVRQQAQLALGEAREEVLPDHRQMRPARFHQPLAPGLRQAGVGRRGRRVRRSSARAAPRAPGGRPAVSGRCATAAPARPGRTCACAPRSSAPGDAAPHRRSSAAGAPARVRASRRLARHECALQHPAPGALDDLRSVPLAEGPLLGGRDLDGGRG